MLGDAVILIHSQSLSYITNSAARYCIWLEGPPCSWSHWDWTSLWGVTHAGYTLNA